MMRIQNMKTVLVSAVLLALGLNLVAPAYGQIILIDFGNDSSYRGVDTPSPDDNGNDWNSVDSAAYYPDLVDSTGAPTAIDLGFKCTVSLSRSMIERCGLTIQYPSRNAFCIL